MPLFSRIQGKPENPALVFLHGFLGNVNDWDETIQHLKDDYYCICLDLPGHGHSFPNTPPLNDGFQYCHRLIKRVLDDLQVKQYTFIAYSGINIALALKRLLTNIKICYYKLHHCII